MQFKTWLIEASIRVRWDYTITLPALGIQNTTIQPKLLNQGTHADIYKHPTDTTKLVKITNDNEDAANTISAQSLNSPNVVKCHAHTTTGVVNGTALLINSIKGKRAPYSTPEFLGLIEGQQGSEPREQAHIRIMRPNIFRNNILQKHGQLNKQELMKLSSLFRTIYLLENKLNIFLVDLADNVINTGPVYVIVDFGR